MQCSSTDQATSPSSLRSSMRSTSRYANTRAISHHLFSSFLSDRSHALVPQDQLYASNRTIEEYSLCNDCWNSTILRDFLCGTIAHLACNLFSQPAISRATGSPSSNHVVRSTLSGIPRLAPLPDHQPPVRPCCRVYRLRPASTARSTENVGAGNRLGTGRSAAESRADVDAAKMEGCVT